MGFTSQYIIKAVKLYLMVTFPVVLPGLSLEGHQDEAGSQWALQTLPADLCDWVKFGALKSYRRVHEGVSELS